MTSDRDLDRVLDQWFAEGPNEAPDRVFDDVADRIEGIRQRPAWRLRWRFPTMPVTARSLATVAVLATVLAVLAVGLRWLPSATTGGPSPTPPSSTSPAPTPSPSPSASIDRLEEARAQMDAGTYVYDLAEPNVDLTVPEGWFMIGTTPRSFGLRPGSVVSEASLRVWYDMRIASRGENCPEEPEPGIGPSADEMIEAYRSDPAIVSTTTPISLGGLDGVSLDLRLAPDWTEPCDIAGGLPTRALFVDDGVPDENAFWGLGSYEERMRLIVLDDGGGSTVLVTVDAPDEATFEALAEAVQPVVDSFEFTPR